jgi:hypothetical protein
MDSISSGYLLPNANEDVLDDDASAWFSGGVPPDVLKLIVDQMPIESVTNLVSSDQAMWQAYTARSGQVPYASVDAIRTAVLGDGDINATVNAISAIQKEPLMSQPQLMRAFAERAQGLARIGPGHDLPEWENLVLDVEKALIDAFGVESRSPQLRDLRIADVHARHLPSQARLGIDPRRNAALNHMLDFPVSMCGDFIEASEALGMPVPLDHWITFLDNVTEPSRPPSDKFASKIGRLLLETHHITNPIPCLENCGVTATQIARIVIPACAVSLFQKTAFQGKTIAETCQNWGVYAETLAAEMEASIYLTPMSAVRQYDAAMRRFAVDTTPQAVNKGRFAVVREMERDTIRALGNDQTQIDAFLAQWQFANTMTYSVDEWVKKFELLTTEATPLVCQPALLDCWAQGLSTNKAKAREPEIKAQAGAAYAWLHTAITLPALTAHPTLLCRMVVALIRALDESAIPKSQETITTQKKLIADLFAKVPAFATERMLELCIEHTDRMPLDQRPKQFAAFILDPLASAFRSPPSFTVGVIAEATKIWSQLPDKADGVSSKFEVFCERFGIPENLRARAKKRILDGIVVRALSGEFTIDEGLVRGDFDADRAARRYAHQSFRYKSGSA